MNSDRCTTPKDEHCNGVTNVIVDKFILHEFVNWLSTGFIDLDNVQNQCSIPGRKRYMTSEQAKRIQRKMVSHLMKRKLLSLWINH